MTTATPDTSSAAASSSKLHSPVLGAAAGTRSPTFRPSRTSMSAELATSPTRRRSTSRTRQQQQYGTAANGSYSASHSIKGAAHLPRGHDSSDVAALSSSLEEARLDLLPPSARYKCSAMDTSEQKSSSAAGSSHRHDMNTPKDDRQTEASSSTLTASVSSTVMVESDPMGPFEGPEKLLEVWFADSSDDVEGRGLMIVERQVWEDMLDIVKCKVLSVIRGHDADAYLLSESSMFVFPHKLILKTCGTTTLLSGLERLLSIAHDALKPARADAAHTLSRLALGSFVKRCFYSRKSFMFPERQKGPHRDWLLEVSLLDHFFHGGAAYTVGKMNGNHWLLYMTTPADGAQEGPERPLRMPNIVRPGPPQDETLEILMTHLSPASCARFEFPESVMTPSDEAVRAMCKATVDDRGHLLGAQLCETLGLSKLFAKTSLDAFAFEPCGFSANALIKRGSPTGQDAVSANEDGYWTVHVTPEQGSSYASFETNACSVEKGKGLPWLIARVLSIFEPARLSVTLFTSSASDEEEEAPFTADDDGELVRVASNKACSPALAKTAVPLGQEQHTPGDVLHALQLKGYRRTDRIAYEFEDYDLVFISFDKVGASLPRH